MFLKSIAENHEDKAIAPRFGANNFPEQSSNAPDLEQEGMMMHNHLNVDQPGPPWETHLFPPPFINEEEFAKRYRTAVAAEEERISRRKRIFEDEYKIHRYPTILQTNRQIHNEVSIFLYSTLVMEVRPGDVIFAKAWDGIVEPSNKIWRSCPTHVAPKSSITGKEIRYSKLGGTMEPHVFAKFERIVFSADFNFDLEGEDGRAWPTLFVDDQFRTSQEDEERFTSCLYGEGPSTPPVSDIFQEFVNVLVKSPYISHLDVCLGVKIVAAFDIDSEEGEEEEEEEEEDEDEEDRDEEDGVEEYEDEEDRDEEEDDEDEENLERADRIEECEARKENAATKRGMELILEAGVLNPLKQLENVKRFSLSFDVLPCNDVEFEPKHKHLGIIRDLKEAVEGNFLAKGDPV